MLGIAGDQYDTMLDGGGGDDDVRIGSRMTASPGHYP
jgi:hypothetical protein